MRRHIAIATGVIPLALLVLASPALGLTINYDIGGTGPMQFPADTQPPDNAPWGPDGYPGDTVEFEGYVGSVTLEVGETVIQKINTLHWIIDYTYGGTEDDPDDWSDLQFPFDAERSVALNGVASGAIDQEGLLEVTWFNDYLTIYEGPSRYFFLDRYRLEITPLGLARQGGTNFNGGNPWTQPDRDVMGQFALTEVPEPSTLMTGSLLLGMLGSARLFLRRRRS